MDNYRCGEELLSAAHEAAISYPMIMGRPGDWRIGVAAAYLRHLRWIRPDDEVPMGYRAEFERIVDVISRVGSSIPGFIPDENGAVRALADRLEENIAEQLATDIFELESAIRQIRAWDLN